MARVCPLSLVALVAACGSHGATPPPVAKAESPSATAPAPTTAAPAPAAPAGPPPTLAATPRLDLAANRARWHVYDRGLVLTVADEGLRKYDQSYRSPWSAVRGDGAGAYRTARGPATLTFPWTAGDGAGPVTAIVRGDNLARARLRLDGRPLPAPVVDGDRATVTVPTGLAPGEHTLTVEGRDVRWRSIELATSDGPACAEAGTWRQVALYAELPAGAHLAGTPAVPGEVVVRTVDEGGAARELYRGPAAGLATPRPVLVEADHVVRLELAAVDGCARWDDLALGVIAPPPPAAAPPPPRHLILMVVDTLRADRLAAYGPTRVTTPRLTAAAARGAVFLRHQSMAPSSPPSHATLHTGQIPRVHGITGDDGTLGADTPIVSALLAGAGFVATYAGNNDFAMSRFKKVGRWQSFTTPYYAHGKDCAPIIEAGLAAVRAAEAAGQQAFVSLLPIEPHVAYRFHDGITEAYWPGPWPKPFARRVTGAHLGRLRSMKLTDDDWHRLRALYDGEVTRFDACYGALEDGLRAAGVLDATAIVLASDHGEGLGERGGRAGHAYGLHRELVATPLIILGGAPAARVTVPTSNLDVAPTLLELAGVPPDPRMMGQSLLPLARAAVAWPRVVASEYGKSYGLRAGRWHLVVDYDGTQHLYDVVADPDSERDRAGDAAVALRYLRDGAGLFLAHRTRWHAATWGDLTNLAPGNPLAVSSGR